MKKSNKREIASPLNKVSSSDYINSMLHKYILTNLENKRPKTLESIQNTIKNMSGVYIPIDELHYDSIEYFSELMSSKGGILYYLDSKGLLG